VRIRRVVKGREGTLKGGSGAIHDVFRATALVAADLLRVGITGVPAPTASRIAATAREIRTPVYDGRVNDP
jgi:hypothetical protein